MFSEVVNEKLQGLIRWFLITWSSRIKQLSANPSKMTPIAYSVLHQARKGSDTISRQFQNMNSGFFLS